MCLNYIHKYMYVERLFLVCTILFYRNVTFVGYEIIIFFDIKITVSSCLLVCIDDFKDKYLVA